MEIYSFLLVRTYKVHTESVTEYSYMIYASKNLIFVLGHLEL